MTIVEQQIDSLRKRLVELRRMRDESPVPPKRSSSETMPSSRLSGPPAADPELRAVRDEPLPEDEVTPLAVPKVK